MLWAFLLLPKQILAADYYVAPGGNNSSSGSIDQPFLTVQKAINTVSAGDNIYLRSGTYNENVIIYTIGTSANPITLQNFGNEVATINGGSEIALRSAPNSSAAYWIIDGITIRGTGRYTTVFGWWGETATSNMIVRNCNIFGANFIMGSYSTWENNNINGTGYAGTFGDGGICDGNGSNNNVYRNNIIHDFTNSDARGIWTQGNSHHNLIENNTIYNINGSGLGQCIDLDGASTLEWNHTVRGNTVSGCSYVGIQLENVFASTIENNNIDGTGASAGIIVINYDSVVGCTAGGGYGDLDGNNNCEGNDTENIIRQNVIWTTGVWSWGYGGIMNWYAGGLHISGNTIYSSADGGASASINFQGTLAETGGAEIISNILTSSTGVGICALD